MSDDRPEKTHANNCQSHYGDVVKGGRLPCNCDPTPTGSETAEEILERARKDGLWSSISAKGDRATYTFRRDAVVEIIRRALAANEERVAEEILASGGYCPPTPHPDRCAEYMFCKHDVMEAYRRALAAGEEERKRLNDAAEDNFATLGRVREQRDRLERENEHFKADLDKLEKAAARDGFFYQHRAEQAEAEQKRLNDLCIWLCSDCDDEGNNEYDRQTEWGLEAVQVKCDHEYAESGTVLMDVIRSVPTTKSEPISSSLGIRKENTEEDW